MLFPELIVIILLRKTFFSKNLDILVTIIWLILLIFLVIFQIQQIQCHMKKPVSPKALPYLKSCKPEPGPGPIVTVQARARPTRGNKLKPDRARENSGPTHY